MVSRKRDLSKFFPDRTPARFIVRLFAEGETEAVYLQKIASSHHVRVESELIVSSPVRLLENAVKWSVDHAKMLRRDNGRNRVWVIFDDDAKAADMAEVIRVWKTCPETCSASCGIRDRNKCEFKDVIDRIRIGFMTPCVEIWGLMCAAGKDSKTAGREYPADRHKLQSMLHTIMPSYVHDGHPYFEIDKMSNWASACSCADNWARTFGTFPSCTRATRYAGIAPLVREIMEG